MGIQQEKIKLCEEYKIVREELTNEKKINEENKNKIKQDEELRETLHLDKVKAEGECKFLQSQMDMTEKAKNLIKENLEKYESLYQKKVQDEEELRKNLVQRTLELETANKQAQTEKEKSDSLARELNILKEENHREIEKLLQEKNLLLEKIGGLNAALTEENAGRVASEAVFKQLKEDYAKLEEQNEKQIKNMQLAKEEDNKIIEQGKKEYTLLKEDWMDLKNKLASYKKKEDDLQNILEKKFEIDL